MAQSIPARCALAWVASLSAIVVSLPACVATSAADHEASAAVLDESLVVFLVRHAEKTGGGSDAALSEAGVARARALVDTLRDAGIGRVHSTDYARTRDTAGPIASALGLGVELYDPRDLGALAARLRSAGGRHLVVGHSNTTPALVALLGGDAGPPIDESSEYDRFYVVMRSGTSGVGTAVLRYGDIAPGG